MRSAFVLVALCLATPARADSDDIVGRPLVLDRGQLAAELTAEINAAPGQIALPISFAPDVSWGATSRLTIGVFHSRSSVDRFAPGASFCVRAQCRAFYNGSGIDVRWAASPGIVPRLRLLARELDPWKPAVLAGALLGWRRGRFAIVADPYLQLGLANTDRGNRSALFLPISLTVQPTCRWALTLRTGWNSDLAVWTDGWHIPIFAGVRARATEHFDVAAGLGFSSLLGPQNTAKERVVFLAIGWRS
ncbi:MAG: hypothetical protein JWO36_2887 [Myxococcales bacterium]|nr:hypothetical protein [Myxococcales bacterium]